MAKTYVLAALFFMLGACLVNNLDFARSHSAGMRRGLGLLMSVMFLLDALKPSFAQQFVRRTQEAGFAAVPRSNGAALADYDRDGDLDVYFVNPGIYQANDPSTWNRLFANHGNGTFLDVTAQAGVAGRNANTTQNPTGMGNKMGAAWGDYDNDGWPDLFLTHYGPIQLFNNNGNGTFTDVTAQSGITTRRNQLSSSALWFDYDNDGDLDLYISIYGEFFSTSADRSNKLYENSGNGEFVDVSSASGAADKGITWTTVALDANHDGHLDLYLANDFGPNKFYLNNGDKTFQEKTADFGLEDPYHGMGLAVTDCDGNGYFDIYLTNITEAGFEQEINPLFLNTGQGLFYNYSVPAGVSQAGWGWGAAFFDCENDGDEDLFVATGNFTPEFPNEFFHNESEKGDFRFANVAHEAGVADSTVARGAAVFDYDNDGDLDLLISNFFEPPFLYENTATTGNWLRVKLEGTESNRDALGTEVEVWANGKSYKKYHHGAHFLTQSISPVHFGLRDAQSVERILVTWPSGFMEEFGAAAVNQTLTLKEKSGVVAVASGPDQIAINETTSRARPSGLRLLGNYPNPFNGATQIRFEIHAPGMVELTIMNAQGKIIRELRESYSYIGEKIIHWNGVDHDDNPVSSGIYFYRLTSSNGKRSTEVGKMLYLK